MSKSAALTRLTVITYADRTYSECTTAVYYFRSDDDAHAFAKSVCPAARKGDYGHYRIPAEHALSMITATVCGARYAE